MTTDRFMRSDRTYFHYASGCEFSLNQIYALRSTISYILLLFATGVMIISCQPRSLKIRPTYNKGGFTLSHFKNESKKSIVIFGQVKDIESNRIIRPAVIRMGCLTVQSDNSGMYKMSEESIGLNSFLTCSFIGYRTIETERFNVQPGDSLRIDFFLIQDDRPLINCEGQD